jgi:pimeloyl-ACP methyl ester carboxylesterase
VALSGDSGDNGTRYARCGDVHIAYQINGSGSPDLLLIPDGLISIEAAAEESSFEQFIRELSSFARVIRFDRRGIGLSDPVTRESPPTLEQWMTDALAVMDAVGSEQAALLGIAEGGFVVALTAATHPERVSALVFVNATPGLASPPFREWGMAARLIDQLGDSVGSSWGDDLSGVPFFAPSAAGDAEYADWLSRAMRRAASPAMAGALFDVLYYSDIRDVLPAVRVPTLVVHRSGNRWLTREHGRYLAEHISGARYVEVPGDDHVPYIGDPGPILGEVEEFITGTRRRPASDRVLATVLFTDIVGSTEQLAALGDERWKTVLLRHQDLVRKELRFFQGREVDTAGDGFFATFDGPARAVRCACAAVEAIRPLGIEIRAGLHTGECELVGEKVGGIAVHIGARIAALAGPAEVLVSRTVKDLVAGSGISFEERGLRRLKGVQDEWQVFAVVGTSV